MNYCVVYGSPRKNGNTYQLVQSFKNNLEQHDNSATYTEFFLPKDCPEFCKGCFGCIFKGEDKCPHANYIQPIVEAMCACDGTIFSSPVYVMECSGQMKVLLDHMAYMFIIHRPRKEMFTKSAVVLSTTAGAGTKYAIDAVKRSLTFWGVSRIRTMGVPIMAESFDAIPQKRKKTIDQKLQTTAEGFVKDCRKKTGVHPKVWFWFTAMKIVNKRGALTESDKKYWKEQAWLDGNKPWKAPKNKPNTSISKQLDKNSIK